MTDSTDKARQTLLDKYGGEEGLKQHYRNMQKKSREHPNNQRGQHIGGFSNKELAREAGAKGGAVSKRRKKDVSGTV